MDADFRKEQRRRSCRPKALKRIVLPDLDREYTLYEIAIITSAGPARALGLTQKGHLGVGADADVAIYQRRTRTWRSMFSLSALRHQGRRGRRRGGRDPQDRSRAREFVVQPDVRREDRGLHPAAVPAALHDVVRQLPGGDASGIEHPDVRAVHSRPQRDMSHMITLTLKERPHVPLEAEVLSPDVLAPLAHDEVRALPVFLGKRQCRLDDFFDGRGRRPATSSRFAATSAEGQVDRPRHDARPHHASSATPACTSAPT